MFTKLEQFLFYFLFFAIPFQTRKILYSSGWYFNEWQAVSIYATDILLIVLFLFWGFSALRGLKFSIKSRFSIFKKLPKYDLFLFGFLVAALISVKNSSDFYVGLFLWLKLVEFAAFYFYLKTYSIRKFNFVKILYALVLGGSFQAIIAIAQFLKQGDLGLKWMGESILRSDMTGVASFFNIFGEKVVRAYGTTPHPNVLAAYLFLAIFALYFLWFYKKFNPIFHILYTIYYILFLFAFFFTFSRTVIFLWAVGFLIMIILAVFKNKFREQFWHNVVAQKKLIQIIFITILVVAIFSILYWPEVLARATLSSDEEAVQLRIFYNKESLGGGLNLFGIGLGDFTSWLMEQNPNLPRHLYQPVHNIYLLLYSETGLLGISMFLLFLFFLIKKSFQSLTTTYYLLLTASILFIGLFDHFLLTLQQGRFMFWLILTMLVASDVIEAQSERRSGHEKASKSDQTTSA